jgi:2'-5' RNA ligase
VASLSLCLLLDEQADQAVRRLWRQLEDDGVPSLTGHTHGRHVPHLTLASLGGASVDGASVGGASVDDVREAVARLPEARAERVTFAALGSFTRSRCSLVPAVSTNLMARHERVVAALLAAGTPVHRHYLPGAWLPHLTLATRSQAETLPRIARRVYEVLPLIAVLERAAVVDTSSGEVHPLERLV